MAVHFPSLNTFKTNLHICIKRGMNIMPLYVTPTLCSVIFATNI